MILWTLFGFALGVWFMLRLRKKLDEKEMPYRWKCGEDECHFHVKGNDAGIVDGMVGNHEETHK